ncbi:unnamed protein product [Sympodiomycopsis kandeliae]
MMFKRKKRTAHRHDAPPTLPQPRSLGRESFTLENMQRMYGLHTRMAGEDSLVLAEKTAKGAASNLPDIRRLDLRGNGQQFDALAEEDERDLEATQTIQFVEDPWLQKSRQRKGMDERRNIVGQDADVRGVDSAKNFSRPLQVSPHWKPSASNQVQRNDVGKPDPHVHATPYPQHSSAPVQRQRNPSPRGSANGTSVTPVPSADRDFRASASPWAGRTALKDDVSRAEQQDLNAARQKALKRVKACKPLRIMVLGSTCVGKTSWIKSFVESLQPSVNQSPSEMVGSNVASRRSSQQRSRHGVIWSDDLKQRIESFALPTCSTFGRARLQPTRKMESLGDLEVMPSKTLLLTGMVNSDYNAKETTAVGEMDETASSIWDTHNGRFSSCRGTSSRETRTTAYLSLGAAAPPQRLSLSIIDTPALPSPSSHLPRRVIELEGAKRPLSGSAPPAAFPIMQEITSRYMNTLREERKLNRLPTRSTSVEGQHIHLVLWFIDPRQVLEGEWWYKAQEEACIEKQWQQRIVFKRSRAYNSSKSNGPVPVADVETNLRQTPEEDNGQSLHSIPRVRRLLSKQSARSLDPGAAVASDKEVFPRQNHSIDAVRRRSGSANPHLDNESPSCPPIESQTQHNTSTSFPEAARGTADDEEYVPTLSPSEKMMLSYILPIVPVMPVISRADSLTVRELELVRQGIKRGWREVLAGLRESRNFSSSDAFHDIFPWDASSEEGAEGLGWEWDWCKDEDEDDEDDGATSQDLVEEDLSSDLQNSMDHEDSCGVARGVDVKYAPMRGEDRSPRSSISRRRQSRSPLSRQDRGHVDDMSDARFLLGVEDIVPSAQELRLRWPLSIFSPEPETLPSSIGKSKDGITPFSRQYPPHLGTLNLLDPSHSDFLLLRCILLGTHTGRIALSSKYRYESWRRQVVGGLRERAAP